MAKRNMIETASKVNFHNLNLEPYDLNVSEMLELKEMVTEYDKLFTAISTAFKYGFVLGHRATRNGRIKKAL